jgi:MFS family permease
MQGFSIIFTIWIQAGMGFSPLGAGLTLVGMSVGSFVLAPVAVPLAQRYGRIVLFAGGLLMALGMLGILLGAGDVGVGSDPWPVVPGMVIVGAGLSLLVIPLANVVLAAVPREVAGGAGGMFSTAQMLGGALGIAVVGSVFFSHLASESFTAAFKDSAPFVIALFAIAAALALVLPRTAVADAAEAL